MTIKPNIIAQQGLEVMTDQAAPPGLILVSVVDRAIGSIALVARLTAPGWQFSGGAAIIAHPLGLV
jgi:hypothetical protein